MAGDWIQWEKGLYKKPEILQTARMMSMTVAHACLTWMRFWEWADENTTDGNILGITVEDVDTMLGLPGFAECGMRVGWLAFDQSLGLKIINFIRHNGEPAKKRALDALRKRTARGQKKDK